MIRFSLRSHNDVSIDCQHFAAWKKRMINDFVSSCQQQNTQWKKEKKKKWYIRNRNRNE